MAISIDRRNYLCAGKRWTLELTAQAGKKIKLLLQLLRITGLVGSVGCPRKTGLNLPDPGHPIWLAKARKPESLPTSPPTTSGISKRFENG